MYRQFGMAAVAAIMVLSTPALAGTLSFAEGKTTWQSTMCKEPPEPQSLLHAHRETPADHMNVLMMQYNTYANAMQEYMNCISGEAQTDSNTASQAIAGAAQGMINEAQQKVNDVSAGLHPKD